MRLSTQEAQSRYQVRMEFRQDGKKAGMGIIGGLLLWSPLADFDTGSCV